MLNSSHIDMCIPTKEQLTSVVYGKEFSAKIHMQDEAYEI